MGPIEEATSAHLAALGEESNPLGRAALILAHTLDEGAGMATAAVAREFRAYMKELTPHDGGDDFTRLMAALSAEVRDSSPT